MKPDALPVSDMERNMYSAQELVWQFAFRMALTGLIFRLILKTYDSLIIISINKK